MPEKTLYDLSVEAEYSDEDREVFELVWSHRASNELNDKVIVQSGESLYLMNKPGRLTRFFWRCIGGLRVLGYCALLVIVVIIAGLLLWEVVKHPALLLLFPVAIWLIDMFYGGNTLCPKLK